jgi:hypothetical protein
MLRAFALSLLAASAALAQTPAQPLPPTPFNIDDWTPRPAAGKNSSAWERKKDPEWDDARFLSMNTGPFQNATFKFPLGTKQEYVYKGMAVKIGDGTVLFDRATMRYAAAWTGGYLQHSQRRFALLNTPTPAVNTKMIFGLRGMNGWADSQGMFNLNPMATAPTQPEHSRYRGHYVNGDRVVFSYTVHGVGVLDTARLVEAGGKKGIIRTLQIDPSKVPLSLKVDEQRNSTFPPSEKTSTFFLNYGDEIAKDADDLATLTKPGPARWGKPIVTKLERGKEDSPFAIDTLTIPYENPFKALFFCTGLDFLPDGRVAMCTCHGDVWLVKVNDKERTVEWQRHATGLYHPLGVKVVDGKVVVLERGQLTRLHDNNNDGETDFYECISNQWDTGSGEHAYDTCLETDSEGNFYFFKTGDTNLPTGGCLLKVSKDGSKTEVFATGFRHPIGMGMSPDGKILTGADQEGNWMPATRIDEYKKGGFYGDMRAAHRNPLPTTYDPPICWLPREVDNSAGGQTWVPEGKFGDLAGIPIHFSYGRCRAYLLLRGENSGGVAPLALQFLSGACRGRFHADGSMYVCGLNGWQTAAQADGSLQRVRYTGKPVATVLKQETTATGVKLTFSQPLDPELAANPVNYKAAWWNYRWSGDYGSKRWKVSNPNVEGQDEFEFASAKMLDEKTVELTVAGGVRPVMQFQIGYNVKTKAGDPITRSVFLTIHGTAK